jgi:hypothetical protein
MLLVLLRFLPGHSNLKKKILKECPFWFHAEELENVGLKF